MRTRIKILLALFGALTVVMAAAPWLVPMSRFIPLIEATAQARLGEPVSVGRLRLHLLPVPRLVASEIVVGENAMLRIASLTIRPGLRDAFATVRRVREVRAEGVVVTEDALRAAPAWRAAPSAQPPTVEVMHVTVHDARLELRAFTVREVSADISLEGNVVRRIEIRATQDRLRVVATPEGQGDYRLDIAARDWQPPLGPAVRFARLDATARLTARGISTRELTAVIYGGSLRGPLAVSWTPTWRVTGAINLKQVDLRPLTALFMRDTVVSGLLTANPKFTAQAAAPRGLLDALDLQSDFSVENGVLQKVDLHAVARNPLARDATKGGVTRFSRLSGRLEVDRDGYHFGELKVAAGMLSATGDISVARDGQLTGRMEAAIGGTGSLMAMPMQVTGTLKEPTVRPTRTAVAAAVAGSVLLPGLGTAVGLKASQLAERLFGAPRRRPPAGPAASPSLR
jgi:uncharacterized protein involved in outer membrane biogenesis